MGLFYDDADIRSILQTVIRCGKVSSVDYANCTARVVFPDDDNEVSYDLPVLQRNALDNRDYAMPDIDESVLCIFLPIGSASDGFIVGSFYSMDVPRPEATGNKRTVVFADGTRVSYDRAAHELTAEIEATKITANRADVFVNTPNSVIVTAANNVTVNTQQATVKAATAYVLNTGTATVNAPAIVLNGDVLVTGTVTAVGDVIAGGISLIEHKHTGNQGKPTSSPIA